eukprot:gnl/MRDRNA2_/MRDRNA2_141970_c0_seq1.p1 gnl/MRDRNA2_/MRDRNA2_141970_c0~~gnl/MRDRNA2_/MRDRNA2_141970_c0_seq1.p1  ORF type:complete len:155 (+),score=17.67 gnl/MRDRNA2_/MRDRNA2_141970_c0_seq1:87-551(+)
MMPATALRHARPKYLNHLVLHRPWSSLVSAWRCRESAWRKTVLNKALYDTVSDSKDVKMTFANTFNNLHQQFGNTCTKHTTSGGEHDLLVPDMHLQENNHIEKKNADSCFGASIRMTEFGVHAYSGGNGIAEDIQRKRMMNVLHDIKRQARAQI